MASVSYKLALFFHAHHCNSVARAPPILLRILAGTLKLGRLQNVLYNQTFLNCPVSVSCVILGIPGNFYNLTVRSYLCLTKKTLESSPTLMDMALFRNKDPAKAIKMKGGGDMCLNSVQLMSYEKR